MEIKIDFDLNRITITQDKKEIISMERIIGWKTDIISIITKLIKEAI